MVRAPDALLGVMAEEEEWEQGSGPKGPMSCRTQGWMFIHPERAYLRPLQQLSMIFNGSFTFFSFFIISPWYSLGSLHFFNFSCYSMGIWGLRSFGGEGQTYGGMYRWTDRHLEIHPCVLQDIGPLGPLPKKLKKWTQACFYLRLIPK